MDYAAFERRLSEVVSAPLNLGAHDRVHVRFDRSQFADSFEAAILQLDELTAHATASLNALMQQRNSLKGVQRKVLDLAQQLGLSNNVLRMIERRAFWDKVILYGGMLATLGLIWFVFKYMRA